MAGWTLRSPGLDAPVEVETLCLCYTACWVEVEKAPVLFCWSVSLFQAPYYRKLVATGLSPVSSDPLGGGRQASAGVGEGCVTCGTEFQGTMGARGDEVWSGQIGTREHLRRKALTP